MPIASEAAVCNMALARIGVATTINSLNDPNANARACNTFYAQCLGQLLEMYRWPRAIKRQQLTNFSGAAWSAATSYAKGQYVQYGESTYVSVVDANLNNEPDTSSSVGDMSPLTVSSWRQVTRNGWTFAAYLPSDFVEGISVYELPLSSAPAPQPVVQTPSSPLRTPRNDQRVPYAIEDAQDGTDAMLFLSDVQNPVLVYVALVTNPQAPGYLFTSALAWLLASEIGGPLRADMKLVEAAKKAFYAALGEAASAAQRGQQEDPEPISDFEGVREGAYGRGGTGQFDGSW